MIKGDLYQNGNGGDRASRPPKFQVTVPKVNLQWDGQHGECSEEAKEDEIPAALLVSDKSKFYGTLIEVGEIAEELIPLFKQMEIKESDRVTHYNSDTNNLGRGYLELKAKESAGYNAAWLYDCTYLKLFGPNPKHKIHKAYQKPQLENYEVR